MNLSQPLTCPHCHQTLTSAGVVDDRRLLCPLCGHIFVHQPERDPRFRPPEPNRHQPPPRPERKPR